ncbi:MAG: cupin domain-containing protein [Burkholderiales bacterium]|nr:cupin domain-containing protein [Burkholderiales bacterium]
MKTQLKITWVLGALALGLMTSSGASTAQAFSKNRTIIGKVDLSTSGREAVVTRLEVPPGVKVELHSHAGEETGYVLEGEATLQIDGQAPQVKKAGQSFVIPAGVAHDAYNHGSVPAKVLGVYLVDKGQPLALPAH